MYKTCIVRSEQLPRSESEHFAQYQIIQQGKNFFRPERFMTPMHLIGLSEAHPFHVCMYYSWATCYLASYTLE